MIKNMVQNNCISYQLCYFSIFRNQNCNFVSCPYLVKSSFHHSLIHIYTNTHAKISPFYEISILFLSFWLCLTCLLSLMWKPNWHLLYIFHSIDFNIIMQEKWVGGNFINIFFFVLCHFSVIHLAISLDWKN